MGPGGEFLVTLLDRWLTKNPKMAQEVSGRPGTWPIWDEVTTAYLLGLTKSETHPRPTVRDDRTFDHAHPRGTLTWITAIDADRLWADLAKRLEGTR